MRSDQASSPLYSVPGARGRKTLNRVVGNDRTALLILEACGQRSSTMLAVRAWRDGHGRAILLGNTSMSALHHVAGNTCDRPVFP
jgi:hypothetical protein